MTIKSICLALSLAVTLPLTGCDNDDDSGISVQSPADYAIRSSANYAENTSGLVTAEYAASLITDWQNNKPAGKRYLFIMQYGNLYGFEGTHIDQATQTERGNGYVKSNPDAGVFVFDIKSGFTDSGEGRGDGVSSVPQPVLSIKQMDAAFSYYGIDPDRDVLLLALASPHQSTAGKSMGGVSRMWYTLTYWGFPQESLMLLDGQASHVLDPDNNADIVALLGLTRDDIFTALPSEPPVNPEWKSISTVKVDGTILQATMEDMMNVIDANNENELIIDARSEAEYLGAKAATTEYKVCGENHNQQCYTAFDGHLKGAKNLIFTNVLNIDDGTIDLNNDGNIDYKDASFRFKAIYEIEALFEIAAYHVGKTVYIYCKTGTKASLLTFTSAAVLGYDTRMYDGSWIQWGKMANLLDTNGNELLPENSKWRTDIYSDSVEYNLEQLSISPLNTELLNLEAELTNAMILTDKASK
jgi:3-mercaptopyruvate sulfurtransferase SseA